MAGIKPWASNFTSFNQLMSHPPGSVQRTNTVLLQVVFGLGNTVGAIVKDAGGQHALGSALKDPIHQMLQRAYTTRSNDRNGHGIAHCTGELQIKTALGAILIHAGQQDLASPQLSDTLSPLNDIQSGTVFAALGAYLPVARGVIIAFGIDGNDEPFGAQGLDSLADELRAMNSCAVDGDLGRASLTHGLQVGQAAHPTAHNEWYIRIHGKLDRKST